MPRAHRAPAPNVVPNAERPLLSPAPPALDIRDLVRRFRRTVALDGLSLCVAQSEIVCLMGQSGCGKSSLLRVIAGVDAPDAGQIAIDGRIVAGPNVFVEPDQRGVGFMFQDYALFPHLTVAQNVGFGLAALPRDQRQRRVADMLDRIGITPLAGRHPHSLSGGEQQRVALARALAPRPALLLMDEPFSNLDRGLRDRLRSDTIAQLRALGTAAIIVTHDPEEALSTGDRLAVMRAGRIVQDGPARDVYRCPASPFVAELLGSSTRVQGVCRGGVVQTALGNMPRPNGPHPCQGGKTCPENAAVLVLIRPEAVSVDPGGPVGAHVQSIAFQGSADQLRLAVAGLDGPLAIHAAPGRFAVGDRLRLSVDPSQVICFPQGSGE